MGKVGPGSKASGRLDVITLGLMVPYVVLLVVVEVLLWVKLKRRFLSAAQTGPTQDNRDLGNLNRAQEVAFGEQCGATYHVPGQPRPKPTQDPNQPRVLPNDPTSTDQDNSPPPRASA